MIRINLLKPEKKLVKEAPAAPTLEIREKSRPPYFGLIVIIALIAIAVLYFYQKNEMNKEQELLNIAQQEKANLQYVVAKLEELENQKTILQRKIDLIIDLQSKQERAVVIMDELSRQIPEWVWLTETTFNGMRVQIKGRSISNNLLADYIHNLDESPHFSNINLISSIFRRVRNNEYFEFSLTARFSPPRTMQASNTASQGEVQ